jgi:hypothetical protein
VKSHKQDSFDGGRGASNLNEPVQPGLREKSLRALVEQRARSGDDEARALALAIMALSPDND